MLRRGRDVGVGDGLRSEGDPVEERVEGSHDGAVRSPVGGERAAQQARAWGHRVGIGRDVRAPERVDRLLRVADEDQPGAPVAAEERGEDVPLDGVGVLELVDERGTEPLAQRSDHRLGAGPVERVPQLREHVVEAQGARMATTTVDRLDAAPDQVRGEALGRIGARLVDRRDEVEVRDPGGDVGGLHERLERREGRRRVDGDRRRGEHVGAHAGEQVLGVVEERRVEVGAGGDAEGPEHLGREPVDRRHRRGVELAHRSLHPLASQRPLLGRGVGQVGKQRVGVESVDPQPRRRVEELLSDARAQLRGGGAREGHDEQLGRGDALLGDEPRGEGRERERLARAGARFDREEALGQRTGRIERLGGHVVALVWISSHNRCANRDTRLPVPDGSPSRGGSASRSS